MPPIKLYFTGRATPQTVIIIIAYVVVFFFTGTPVRKRVRGVAIVKGLGKMINDTRVISDEGRGRAR